MDEIKDHTQPEMLSKDDIKSFLKKTIEELGALPLNERNQLIDAVIKE